MANEEQLSILKQGVEVWNRWRGGNLEIEVDLSGANLSKADLSEANLSEATGFQALRACKTCICGSIRES